MNGYWNVTGLSDADLLRLLLAADQEARARRLIRDEKTPGNDAGRKATPREVSAL